MKIPRLPLLFSLMTSLLAPAGLSHASPVTFINVYTTRNYAGDRALFAEFTAKTGIAVRFMEGDEDAIFEQFTINQKAFPADVFLSLDAGALKRADQKGLLAPLNSKVIESRIPREKRSENWFSFSSRARVIVYQRDAYPDNLIKTYEDLAAPRFRGAICSPSHQPSGDRSLTASIMAHHGAAAAEQWLADLSLNRSGSQKKNELVHLQWIASSDCDIALVNTTSISNYLRSEDPKDKFNRESVVVVWPNQSDRGAHVIYAGAAIAKSSARKEAARLFVEYVVSDEALKHMAENNSEWPAVKDVRFSNALLKSFEQYRLDDLSMERLTDFQEAAIEIGNRYGIH